MTNETTLELSESLASLTEAGARHVVRVDGRRAPASGVAWSPDLVITASHNVEWEEDLAVGLPDGRTVPARLAGRDPSTDLALLRLEGAGLAAPAWMGAEGLRPGQLLLGLTRPGRSVRAGLGLLARVADDWRTPAGGRLDRYLEAELALHPGFSGGLVLDLAGRAVGIGSAGLLRGTAMVVPFPTLRRVAEALLAHGQVRRGFLGVATVPVRLPPALARSGSGSGGLLVTAVEEDSPAGRAGLLLGDVLLSLGGQPTAQLADLLPLLEEERIGASLAARLLRAGEVREMPVTVGARPARSGR